MPAKLFYVGSPLLDMTCPCDVNYLHMYKLKPDDCIRREEGQLHKKLFTEVYNNPRLTLTAGGASQNSARVSKWILRNYPQSRVWLAGCVGHDDNSEVMKDILKKDGVISCYSKHETLPTGSCVCLVTESDKRYVSRVQNQRSMVTDLGAAATFGVRHLDVPETRKIMAEVDLVFISGFFFGHSLDVVEYLAEYCHVNNKLFAITLSAIYVCENYYNDILKCLPYLDLVFGNLEEAQTLLKKMTPRSEENHDAKTCAKAIANYLKRNSFKPRIVVISNGVKPVTATLSHKEPEEYDVPLVTNIVDTIGCGDALAGGFLADYVLKGCVKSAVRTGIQCATKIAQISGCVIPED